MPASTPTLRSSTAPDRPARGMALLQIPMAAMSEHWRVLTRFLRCLPLCVCMAYTSGFLDLDAALSAFWRVLLRQSWSRWPMFEAIVASVSFLMWIFWFRLLDSLPCFQKFRFVSRDDGPLPSELLKRLAGAKAESKEANSVVSSAVMHTWASLPVYLGGIWLFILVRGTKPIEVEAPTFWRLVAEVAMGIVAYDFIFYWLHLAMHCYPRLPHGHGLHHELSSGANGDKFLESSAVVNHSLLDGTLQVAVNICVQNLPLFGGLPKHKLSRLLHNILVTYMLTEAHAGLDLPWATHRVFPEVFGGAFRHEVHHHAHRCCYHQFFKYLDDALGFGPPAFPAASTQPVSTGQDVGARAKFE